VSWNNRATRIEEHHMTRLAVLVAALLLSATATAGAGWTGPRAILGLETYPGGTEIRLAGSGSACTAITEGVQKTWTRIETGQANSAQLMAVLMMAFAAGKTVNIHCPNAADWTALDRVVVESAQ
jgi:hypothetical protein